MARNPHASYEASDHQRMPIIPIANNLTTTSAGYALDARQGKALDDKITSVNNKSNIASLASVFMDKAYGNADSPINIDRINNSVGYIYRIFTDGGSFSGTSPASVLRGNGFILIGFSQVSSSNLIQFGVQIAIGFGDAKIAIRYCPYSSGGSEWRAWTAV